MSTRFNKQDAIEVLNKIASDKLVDTAALAGVITVIVGAVQLAADRTVPDRMFMGGLFACLFFALDSTQRSRTQARGLACVVADLIEVSAMAWTFHWLGLLGKQPPWSLVPLYIATLVIALFAVVRRAQLDDLGWIEEERPLRNAFDIVGGIGVATCGVALGLAAYHVDAYDALILGILYATLFAYFVVVVKRQSWASAHPGINMTTGTFDVPAVRRRFSALRRELAFFDAPGGTQCPDSVIEAIARYLKQDNANVGGQFPTSKRTDTLINQAHQTAARFLGCTADEIAFGQSMTSLNFLLTRAFAHGLTAGDEVLVTQLDHDANVAPWLRLAQDRNIVVHTVKVTDELRLDLDDLASKLNKKTRVVAFTAAANSVGTMTDIRRIAALAHEAGALAWVDAVHYAPHGPINVRALDVDVLLCSPYKFFGPHMGIAFARKELLAKWPAYKVRPAADEPAGHRYELGTCQHELLAGFIAAVEYIESLGWEAICAHERALGERFLKGLPDNVELYGLRTMVGRVPTFSFNLPGKAPDQVAALLADAHQLAVTAGNHYALETILRLKLKPDSGTVRAGFIHYNTEEEVDRLLAGIRSLL